MNAHNPNARAFPKLARDAVTRMQAGEPIYSATGWVWTMANSLDRLDVDLWIVKTNHPLGLQAGTMETRFRCLVEETYVREAQS